MGWLWLPLGGLACAMPARHAAVAAAPRVPFVAVVVSGREEPSHCFVQDRNAAAAVLRASSVRRLGPEALGQLPSVLESATAPLFAYYAGHGMTGWKGETIGASSWLLDRNQPPLLVGDLLMKVRHAPWLVVLSASCYSVWSDVSNAKVPTSVISMSSKQAFEEPDPYVHPQSCSEPSTLGRLIASALEGAADANADCLIADEELATYLNDGTRSWPRERRPEFKVSRNWAQPLPVARITSANCHTNFDFMLKAAKALGGSFGGALNDHVRLAQGVSAKLPVAAERYYVSASPSPLLEEAAARHGISRFPGDLAAALRIAKLAPFTQLLELELGTGALSMTDLATGKPSLAPVRDARDLDMALPGCGTVDAVHGDAIHARFRGAAPVHEVSAREVKFRASDGVSVPCAGLAGNCFRVAVSPGRLVYEGDPIDCSKP